VLLATVGVLQGLCCFVQYCVLVARLFLRPHLVPHIQHTVPIISAFSSASSRISQGEQCISTYIVTNGNQGAIHAPSHWHESFYTQFFSSKLCTAECGTLSVAFRLFMSSALRRAVNAGRRANCVTGRYTEIQLWAGSVFCWSFCIRWILPQDGLTNTVEAAYYNRG
jgi:hypothetical protein